MPKSVAIPAPNAAEGEPNFPCFHWLQITPTEIRAIIPSADSISIEPYPIGFAFFSLSSCFEVVPVAISEWNPEQAPQATVIKSVGKRNPACVFHPVNAGIENAIAELPLNALNKIPARATSIMA